MHQWNDNSFTAIMSGAGFAILNNVTGFASTTLLAIHIQEDLFKAVCVGFVGAIGGLLGKSVFLQTGKLFKKLKERYL